MGTNDTPCPVTPAPVIGGLDVSGMLIARDLIYSNTEGSTPVLHQAQLRYLQSGDSRGESSTLPPKD